ncbi:MerR family transcriptional regulator [Halalkalibacter sp. APA_J-10(15)]|uniref:MerR family transcriptional regulator n=1 Tax=Halalkalibacter sp. APA_J-10(15) TaxID=2933805 RepID=UPI001FF46733|nr:MerR family transcriptional regulator [Halalkalibacter sp. APA_J-10(15)]MCK0473900.1 MerR family transcriptional regulator [Halalkalibacter sp. APA_J-10(15)]
MYTIGKFSKICDVPIKTLRYYDDIGLLKPSYIDSETNYRYYDYDKIDIIKLVLLLKSLHVPLADIKQIIESANPVQWNSMFEQKISELEKQKEQITNEIEDMKQLKMKIDAGIPIIQGPIFSDCYFENWKDTLVYTLRKKIRMKFIDRHVQNVFNQLYAFNLEVNGKLMAIFHDRDLKENEVDVELLVPVKDSNDIDGCRILANGTYACITVKGSYTDLAMGYEMLNKWIVEKDLTQNGEMMEIYEKGLVPDNMDLRHLRPDLTRHPSDFITKICVPIH